MQKYRSKFSFPIGLALMATAFSGLTSGVAHAQFSKISEQEEIEAGRQSAAQAQKQYGPALPASDPRQRRVSRLGALFAAQATRKGIPYSYTVLQNDQVLNAFASPGGPVFVTTRLIATTSNDAELAYVLGHETGHIEHKHIVNAIQKQQKVGLVAGILGSILSRGKAGNIIGAATSVTYTLWQKGFSRDQEADADNYGTRAMARLGFDPRAAVSMLGKLGDGPEGVQKYLSDHPTSPARQKSVTKEIQDENLVEVARKAGGPRLSLNGSDSSPYQNTGFTSGNAPTSGNTYSNGNANQSGAISLGAPLQLVTSGGYRVVLAPVAPIARYAGGMASAESNDTVLVSRGSSYLRMSVGSNQANLNGRQVQLSASPRIIDGRLYAPLGSVAAGLDGSAAYDSSRNAVRVEFGGRNGYLDLP